MAGKRYLIPVLSLFSLLPIYCQVTVWEEDFDGYADGTVSGENNNQINPSMDWVSGGCTACIDTADWWEVRSGTLEARDVNATVYFQTEIIDISGFENVRISLDVNELGDHEGLYFGLAACADQANEDYVNLLYRLDGGSWKLVKNFLNWCGLYDSCNSHTLYGDDGINSGDCRDNDTDWGYAKVTATSLLGSTLEIRVETINSSDTEIIQFDNLLIEGSILMPVSLKSFELTARKNSVFLFWQTINETNNDYFQIERAREEVPFRWESIGVVPGSGTTRNFKSYFFEDQSPYPGRSFYRLRQVDFEGTYQYLPVETVLMPQTSYPYPNPASNYIVVPAAGNNYENPNLSLVDNSGRQLAVRTQQTNN